VGRSNVIILAIALAAGLFVRLYAVAAIEMSADEGASWAAAAAPNVIEVVRLQRHLNPGKLAIHDLAMHGWMRLFGDSLLSLRGMSAMFGTVSILLVFFVVREIFAREEDSDTRDISAETPELSRDWIGAVSALFFALTFTMVYNSREARMYPLTVAMTLVQIWFFMRVLRRGGFPNYLGLAMFTALAVGSHFAVALVVVAECLWLVPGSYRRWMLSDASPDDRSWKVVATFVLTALAMLPLGRAALGIAYGFARVGGLSWIGTPPLTAFITLFERGLGSEPTFMVCAAAALWGVKRAWRLAPQALSFLLLWMFVPPLAMLLISYAMLPIFVDRYALSSVVPFLILVAVGIHELVPGWVRWLALTVVTSACGVALLPIFSDQQSQWMVKWSEAAAITARNLKPTEYAVVESDWMVNVVKYYLRTNPETQVVGAKLEELKRAPSDPAILVINDRSALDDPAGTKFLLWAAPEVLAKFHGVSVRRISPDRIATLRRQ
jgi:mannosyltransferase